MRSSAAEQEIAKLCRVLVLDTERSSHIPQYYFADQTFPQWQWATPDEWWVIGNHNNKLHHWSPGDVNEMFDKWLWS